MHSHKNLPVFITCSALSTALRD